MKKFFAIVILLLAISSTRGEIIVEYPDNGGLLYEIAEDTGSPTDYYAVVLPSEIYKDMKTITIPSTITYEGKECEVRGIAAEAFMDCKSLASISLPDGLQTIGDYAFKNCASLKEFTVPKGITKNGIGKNVFTGCGSISKLIVKCPIVSNSFGDIKAGIREVVLDGVKEIGGSAFYEFWNVSSITIPEGVEVIGANAFKSWALTTVSLPASLRKIDPMSFRDCTKLESIVVAEGNTVYDSRDECNAVILTATNELVWGCAATTIPGSVTSIGKSAFSRTNLKQIQIPSTITSIGSGAFNWCEYLEVIKVDAGNTQYDSHDDCNAIIEKAAKRLLFGCYKTTIPSDVLSIAPNAFTGITKSMSIKLPEGMKKIDKSAFASCNGLQSIVIPSTVTEIDTSAFEACKNIKLKIPASITTIRSRAFRDCGAIDTLLIPATVKLIEMDAWYHCYNLKKINIEDGLLETIPVAAFYNCSNLEEVILPAHKVPFKILSKAFQGCSKLKRVYFNGLTLPQADATAFDNPCTATLYADYQYVSTTESPWKNFSAYIDINTLNLQENGGGLYYNIIGTGDNQYAEVTNDIDSEITGAKPNKYKGDISIPYNVWLNGKELPVRSIEEKAFMNHTAITSVFFEKNVHTIGESAFEGCTGIKTAIADAAGSLETIGNNAFKDCSGLQQFTMPESVNTIGSYAFQNCEALTAIQLPSQLKKLGQNAFDGCKNIKTITLPSNVTSIEDRSFYRCQNLESFSMSDNVKYIRGSAFSECTKLKTIKLPKHLVTIENNAFYRCSSLDSISIPEGVTSIGSEAFRYCYSLSELNLHDGITELSSTAFANCSKLTAISLPTSLEIIDEQAFAGCSKLTAVTFEKKLKTIQQKAFSGCPLKNIYCKALSAPDVYDDSFDSNAYKNATLFLSLQSDTTSFTKHLVWKKFKRGFITRYKLQYDVDGTEFHRDSINGGQRIAPRPIPVKENRRFSGWKGEPDIMPANDVTVTGAFMYQLRFKVKKDSYGLLPNDTIIKTKNDSLFYDAVITTPKSWKDGYSLKWKNLPEKMPANDTIIEGEFLINKYVITYIIDGKEFKRDSVDYRTVIKDILPTMKDSTNYVFEWGTYPTRMPARDITIEGKYIPQLFVNNINIRINREEHSAEVIKYSRGNKNVTTIVIPDSVSLEGAVYPVLSIGSNAFDNYTQLTSITLPKHLQSIGTEAFKKCYKLEEIRFHEIKNIARMAFAQDTKIRRVYSFGNNVPSMSKEAFETIVFQQAKAYVPTESFAAYHNDEAWKQFALLDSITYHAIDYYVDGKPYDRTTHILVDTIIVTIKAPQKEQRRFSGWRDLPQRMPANDTIANGGFAYRLTFNFEGKDIKTDSVFYGDKVKMPSIENRNGHTIVWENTLATMPALDMTLKGSYVPNKYIITYLVDDKEYQKDTLAYNAEIIPPTVKERDGHIFAWEQYPERMPDSDITIKGYYTAQLNINGVIIRIDKNENLAKVINNPNNTNATTIVVPNTVSAEGVTYPVAIISPNAFFGYTKLSNLTLPDHLQLIDAGSFKNCNSLEELHLNQVDSIAQEAFAYNTKLQRVYCSDLNVPRMAKNAFDTNAYQNVTAYVPAESTNAYKADPAWGQFANIYGRNSYALNYIVDGETYKTEEYEAGSHLVAIKEPEKDGRRFSGWSDIPELMPRKDVTVTGNFLYQLVYTLENEILKRDSVFCGETISAPATEIRKGYTLVWSDSLTSMPARDITVNGNYIINKHVIIYLVDDKEYQRDTVDYNSVIIPPEIRPRDGHIFSWEQYPQRMPDTDITIKGYYKAQVTIGGVIISIDKEAKTAQVIYNPDNTDATTIIIPNTVTVEGVVYPVTTITEEAFRGYTSLTSITLPDHLYLIGASAFKNCFSLEEICLNQVDSIAPEAFANDTNIKRVYCYDINVPHMAMNAFDQTVYQQAATHVPNESVDAYMEDLAWKQFTNILGTGIFNLVYVVDGESYKKEQYEVGSEIVPISTPQKEERRFSGWSNLPKQMPAQNVTVTGSFAYQLIYTIEGEIISIDSVFCGENITTPTLMNRKGYTIEWQDNMTTMPAKDITISGFYVPASINDIVIDGTQATAVYTTDGKKHNTLQQGLNVVRLSDGRVVKRYYKRNQKGY